MQRSKGNIPDDILTRCKALWGISEDLVFIRKVANHIYYAQEAKLFFRLTDRDHRNIEEIKSELDWMFFLERKDVQFAHPVKSLDGNHCESINQFTVSVIKEAPGERALKEKLNRNVLYNWGKIIASMHRHTNDYTPNSEIQKRHEWNQEIYHLDMRKYIQHNDGKIYDEFIRVEKELLELPKDKSCYGLIHADLHTGNFHVDENDIVTAFDFDDCVYFWFIYDIVILLWALEDHFNSSFKKEDVLSWIWEGYNTEHILDEFWVKKIPLFYKYRQLLVYAFCKKSMKNPNTDDTSREWMEKTKAKLIGQLG